MPITNDLLYEVNPVEVRRVISEETSSKMRLALESVAAKGTGRNAFIDGYRVGGKTGTAQKAVDGVYLDNNYIISFIGMAPMNNPELVVYVAVDNPKNTIQYGGVVAAPIVKEILTEEDKIILENRELKKKIERLQMENDLLKKLEELERRGLPSK